MYLPGMRNLLEIITGDSIDDLELPRVNWEILPSLVEELISTLSPLEAEVIKLRYNLEGKKTGKLSLCRVGEELANSIGREKPFSRERIRQIEGDALRKLRYPSRCRKIKAYLGLGSKISFKEFLNQEWEFYPSDSKDLFGQKAI